MSLDDFDRCDPLDLKAILKAWDRGERDKWERMRILASITIQPWCKGSLSPSKVCPLPWDKESDQEEHEILSREEAKERYNRLMQAINGEER